MILDALIAAAVQALMFMVDLIPIWPFADVASQLADAWNQVLPYFDLMETYYPFNLTMVCVGLFFTLKVKRVIWHMYNWAYTRLPVIGH